MAKRLASALAIGLLMAVTVTVTGTCAADEPGYRTYMTDGSYADVRDDLQNAIINRGFLIDHVGHVGAMLDRTADVVGDAAAGAQKAIYKNAEVLQFCPLKLTHEAVRASPYAIANCPVAMFVFETSAEPGKIHVGFRRPSEAAADELRRVNERLVRLLDALAREAVGK